MFYGLASAPFLQQPTSQTTTLAPYVALPSQMQLGSTPPQAQAMQSPQMLLGTVPAHARAMQSPQMMLGTPSYNPWMANAVSLLSPAAWPAQLSAPPSQDWMTQFPAYSDYGSGSGDPVWRST